MAKIDGFDCEFDMVRVFNTMAEKVISEILDGDYVIQEVEFYASFDDQTPTKCNITRVLNIERQYVGDIRDMKSLKDKGIYPCLAHPDDKTCSIGFCEKEQKWYGWSHRARWGFGIGSIVKPGDCAYQPSGKDDFAKEMCDFWNDREFHEKTYISSEDFLNGKPGIWICWKYNDKVPNEKLRGKTGSQFAYYPETWGRGEWQAKSLEDAKQMAIDFADNVS